jgi:hypothetical protein
MEDYITPSEQEGQEQSKQDLINASLIFARALGLIFKNDEGIVVDINEDVKLGDEVKKVIVFKQNNQVHIYKCDEDVQEGTAVNLGQPDGESPSEPITESETPIVEE